LDKEGVTRFSDDWWRRLRWKIELFVDNLVVNQDKGWRKLVSLDNQFLRGVRILLKSDRLKEIEAAPDELAKIGARHSLSNKLPVYPAQ
jgi:hypothetical protein